MKVLNSRLKTKTNPDEELLAKAGYGHEERLIKLSVAAEMFGDDSSDAIRKRLPPYDRLTIVDKSGTGASRRTLRLIYSEVVALRDELIHNARQRTDVGRMLARGSSPRVSKGSNLKLVVNE